MHIINKSKIDGTYRNKKYYILFIMQNIYYSFDKQKKTGTGKSLIIYCTKPLFFYWYQKGKFAININLQYKHN